MPTILVKDSQSDVTSGFGFVIFDCDGKEYSLQACLMLNKNISEHNPLYPVYRNAINEDDSGFDDGLCSDGNEPAVELLGYDEAFGLLKKELKKIGVKFL
jgi:hypothetical protein